MTRPLHIVCDPNPFCYGSISALRALVHSLPEVRLTVLATGPVREQCGGGSFARVLACDVKDPASVRETFSHWGTTDLYLAISNNTNIDFVLEQGLPLVFVDILFWMKRRVTSAMRHARSYIIENFPGVAEALRRYGREMHRPRVVGPLISTSAASTRRPGTSQLLVNYGGAQSPDILPGKNTCYPASMTRLVREVLLGLDWSPETVTIAAGARAVASIREAGVAGGLHVETLTQPEYLERLASSRQFLTAPGLNAPFESFALGVPTSFLPPQNLTQVCQLSVYQEHGLAPRGLNLPELYPGPLLSPQAPEAEGTAQVLEWVSRLDTDVAARQAVRQGVVAQLLRSEEERARQLTAQRSFLELLGPPGGEEAASEIRQVLAQP